MFNMSDEKVCLQKMIREQTGTVILFWREQPSLADTDGLVTFGCALVLMVGAVR